VRKKLIARTLATTVTAGTIAVGAVVAQPSPAYASTTVGPVTFNCGIVTCSAYLSRSATKAANQKLAVGGGAYAAITGVVCAPLMVPPLTPIGVACGAVAVFHGGWIAQSIQEAATQHGPRGACLKVTYLRPVRGATTITYWSTNNGNYCKD
jgi:hypothetical protein